MWFGSLMYSGLFVENSLCDPVRQSHRKVPKLEQHALWLDIYEIHRHVGPC